MAEQIDKNEDLENKINLWLRDLTPVFDLDYLNTKKEMLNGLNDGVYYSGIENVKRLKETQNTRVMYVSEHLSEQDFFEIPKVFYREGIEIPSTFAGINLIVRGLTRPSFFIRNPLIVDFKKAGTIVIDRNLLQNNGRINSVYKRTYLQFLNGTGEDEVKGLPGKRGVFADHDTLIFNYGRSRDGKVRPYEFHTLSSFHHHSFRHPELNHFIVPVCITLERTIEDSSFDIQNLIKNSRLPVVERLASRYDWAKYINDNWIKQTGRYGAVADVLSFLVFSIRNQPRGEVYLDFGEPIRVSDFEKAERAKLMEKISESINTRVRVTPTSLVSSIARDNDLHYISRQDILRKINRFRENLPDFVLRSNYLLEDKSDEEVLERGLLFLNHKRRPKTMPYFKDVETYKIRKDSFLLKYYANRIEHLL